MVKSKAMTIKSERKLKGFTIVELLITIVIIGILAVIVVVSYYGIKKRADIASLESDLKNSSTLLELDKTNNDLYPSSMGGANGGKGLRSSPGTEFTYNYVSLDNSYCLSASRGDIVYHIDSSSKVPSEGGCGGSTPTETFAHTFYSDDGWGDVGNSIVRASDSGYVVAGRIYSNSSSSVDVLLAKYSNTGDVLWAKTWGGSGYDFATDVILTNDNAYVLTGTSTSFGNKNESFIAKFTSDGEFTWDTIWGGAENDEASGIVQSADGGYVISGTTNSFGSLYSTDAFIVKFGSNGDKIWDKSWDGGGPDSAADITVANDGGYVIAGYSQTYGSNAFLAKFDVNGNLGWDKTWNGGDWDGANAIISTKNHDGYVIVGDSNVCGEGSVLGSVQHPRRIALSNVQISDAGYALTTDYSDCRNVNTDMFIAKFNNSGVQAWGRTLGGPTSEFASDVAQLSDDSFVISGITNGFDSVGSEYDILQSKISISGDLIWSSIWGGPTEDRVNGIVQSDDGGFVITGESTSYGSLLLTKFTTAGLVGDCPVYVCRGASPGIANPNAVVASLDPEATVGVLNGQSSSPIATIASILINVTNILDLGPPVSEYLSGELSIDYSGENKTECKEWSSTSGKQIKGFWANIISKEGHDFLKVYSDNTEVYSMSGEKWSDYVDISGNPASVLKACLITDGDVDVDYVSGSVDSVYYN